MALAAAAIAFSFMTPTLSFNSHIAVDANTFSEVVPQTDYSGDLKIVDILGTDTIHLGIKFSLKPDGISKITNGDRDNINKSIISDNIDEMLTTLHTSVDIITDYSVRLIIKNIVKQQITEQVDNARETYKEKTGEDMGYTTQEIMAEAEINDAYFTSFAFALYDAADAEDATVDSVSNALFEQIDEALIKAEPFGVDSSSFNEAAKDNVKTNLVNTLTQLKLVEDGGKVTRISQISYMYLSDYLKTELEKKNVSEPLDRNPGEKYSDYSDRLLRIFVFTQIPDIFYQVVGYTSLGLLIGLFVFAGIWAILFLITLIKTFTKKPWTIFGFWFWLVGFFQVILGIGITVFGKFILPKLFDVASLNLPIKALQIAPRTFALIPSIIYLACIIVAIVYMFFKVPAKQEYKMIQGRRRDNHEKM